MIEPSLLDQYPAVPDSEVEWEDLLYRLELMLKGLPIALEQIDQPEQAVEVVRDLVDREAEVAAFLRNACLDEPVDGAFAIDAEAQGDLKRMAAEFLRLRARVFAIVQRRGIEVWSWKGSLASGHRGTIYRVLRHLQQSDTRALAALRQPEAAARC